MKIGNAIGVAVVMGLALTLLPQLASALDFSKDELTSLQEGDTVKKPLPASRENGFYGGSGWVVIDAPVEVVWRELQDWRSYPEVFPKTVAVKELSRKGDRSLLQVRMGHKLLSIVYHLDLQRDAENMKINFHMVTNRAHDIEDTRGYWRLFPQKNGKTLVACVVAAQVPMGIINLIGPVMEEKIERHILGMPGNLKVWIESAHQNSYHKMMASAK